MLAALFLSLRFFLLFSESENEKYDKSDGGRSGSDFTFGSCSFQSDVEIGSDRIISIRVGISSIIPRSSIFLFSVHLFESYLVESQFI